MHPRNALGTRPIVFFYLSLEENQNQNQTKQTQMQTQTQTKNNLWDKNLYIKWLF